VLRRVLSALILILEFLQNFLEELWCTHVADRLPKTFWRISRAEGTEMSVLRKLRELLWSATVSVSTNAVSSHKDTKDFYQRLDVEFGGNPSHSSMGTFAPYFFPFRYIIVRDFYSGTFRGSDRPGLKQTRIPH
jgi:hypothetical protein